MNSIKGNRPLRFLAMMMIVLLIVAHFMGQVDLTEVSFLWLMIAMALNAIQASFSGFCPMFKNARGECVACGVVCDPSQSKAEPTSCCDSDASSSCCGPNDESKTQQACCSQEASPKQSACCGGEKSTSSCCGEASATNCCGESSGIQVKVLGTGCASCNNTAKLIEEVAAQLGINVQVVKVEEVAEIAAYGVMSTPGVVIDEQVVHAGGVPSRSDIEAWLKQAGQVQQASSSCHE